MSKKISWLKSIDNYLGKVVVRVLPPPRRREVNNKSILIIRPGGIGDAVLCLPALCSLKNQCPDFQINVLAESRNRQVFEMCSSVEKVFCYDKPFDLLSVLGQSYKAVIDSEQWYRLSAVVAWLVRAETKVGFSTNERQRLFTHSVEYFETDHEEESFRRLFRALSPLKVQSQNSSLLEIPDNAIANASKIMVPLKPGPVLTIFPGASVPEKQWPPENYKIVIRKCLESGISVIVIGGRNDQSFAKEICGDMKVLNLTGQTNLFETAAIIQKSDLVLSGDSGVLHIAASLGRPTVSMFGPSSSVKWAPQGKKHIVLSASIECSPCSFFGTIPLCHHSLKCLRGIEPEEVLTSIKTLIQT